MDTLIHNYKDKGKLSKGFQINNKKASNSLKKDIIYYKAHEKNFEKSAKLKTSVDKPMNKLNSARYNKLIQKTNYSNNKIRSLNMNMPNKIYLQTKSNKTKEKSKQPNYKLKIALTVTNKLRTSHSNLKSKNNIKNIKDKYFKKQSAELPLVQNKISRQNIDKFNNKLFKEDSELNKEYQKLNQIWEETGVTKTYIKNFEKINNNKYIDNTEEIQQIINAEINQMTQFKNDIIKTVKLIEKRNEEIKNIKDLDKKYSNFNIYLNFEDESDANNMLNTKDVLINKNEIDEEIHKSLCALRIKGINVVSQIRKIKMKYSNLINIGKIDTNFLKEKYGYDKNYLIQLINDLDFLKNSNLKNLYHFSQKGQDPFLLSLSSKSEKANILSNSISRETKTDFFNVEEEDELISKIENDNKDNTIITKGKKYKTLSMTKEIWSIVKKLMYYLSQEILFNMVKLEQEEMNNLSTHHQPNQEISSVKYSPNLNDKENKRNINKEKNNNKENIINPSKAIANLKSMDSNKYNQLFFNKTLLNSKSNNEKRIIKKSEKMNIFLKLNKDIELFEKKLRGEKFIDLEDSKDKDYIDIFNILNKNPKNTENKNKDDKQETNLPKIGSHKDIKKLVIRTNTSDYFKEKKEEIKEEQPKKKTKRPTIIVEEKMQAKLKKEESIFTEVERRIKIEVDKKIKKIEDSIIKEMNKKMEINKNRLQQESKLIEEEKKKLEKFLETQKNLRLIEEQRRAKLALEHQKELEREEELKKAKKKEQDLLNQKMRKDLEEKIMNEIEKKFKEQEELIKMKEKEEIKKRQEKEEEIDLRLSEELKKKMNTEQNMQELLVRIRKEEIEKIKKEEIDKMRHEHLDKIMNDNLDYLITNENHKR